MRRVRLPKVVQRYTICLVMGHVSTSTMQWRMCDRCIDTFHPAFSEYLATKSSRKEGLTEKVSVGSGLLVKLGLTDAAQIALRK